MKQLSKFAILGALIGASTSLASANPIQLGSYATAASNDGNSNTALQFVGVDQTGSTLTGLGTLNPTGSTTTYTLSPGTVWSGPLANSTWVGEAANSGPGGTVNPPYGYYEYQTTFGAAGGTYNGILNVLADDTVEVLLNNVDILNFGVLGNDTTCSDNPTGCLTSTETSLALSDITLDAGTNTLDFIVEQAGTPSGAAGSDPSGVDFNAELTPTPEPGSLFLLGTGLIGAAGMARRKFAMKLAS